MVPLHHTTMFEWLEPMEQMQIQQWQQQMGFEAVLVADMFEQLDELEQQVAEPVQGEEIIIR